MNIKKRIFAAIALVLIVFSLFVIFYAQTLVFFFAGSNNLDISYKKLQTNSLTSFTFTDLKITQHKKETGLSSSNAQIRLSLNGPDLGAATINFVLKDVRFLTKNLLKEVSYNNVDDLVAMPFSTLWNYRELSGSVRQASDGIYVKDLRAEGDSIKLSFDGLLTRDNRIKADIGISFDKKLLGKIPPDLTNMVLKDSDSGWKSLNVKLEGDLTKPVIQITGKMFRLNIGVKQ